MFQTVLKGGILLFMAVWLAGCGTSLYLQGEKSLAKEDFDAAIASFERALKDNPEDLQLLRECGIAYYRKPAMDQAIPLLFRAFAKDSIDGRTLFYLGTAYEIRKEYARAMDIYRRYATVGPLDGIRQCIEGRLIRLARKQMEEEIRAALADEKNIQAAAFPESTVAVLNFINMGKIEELKPLEKGLAEMLITDLAKVKTLKVVERIRMQSMVEEMGLGQAGLVDNATAPRAGRLLGAAKLVHGTYLDIRTTGLRIDAGVIRTSKGKVDKTGSVEGESQRIFQLEKDLVFKIIQNMGITISQEERDDIQIVPTENLLAFMAYCRGMDNEDRALYREASEEYGKAVGLDPNFERAKQSFSRTEALSASEKDISELEKEYAAQSESPQTGELGAVPASMEYMYHIGSVLNQGFLPGIDSRIPALEQSRSGFGSTAEFEIIVPLPPSP